MDKPKTTKMLTLLGGRLEPLVRCNDVKQTQEELTERLLFYETGNSKLLPNPNLRGQFRNQGIYWNPLRYNKG